MKSNILLFNLYEYQQKFKQQLNQGYHQNRKSDLMKTTSYESYENNIWSYLMKSIHFLLDFSAGSTHKIQNNPN